MARRARGSWWRPVVVVPARAGSSAALLATVLAMGALAATLAAAIPTYADAVETASLRADVAAAAPTDAGVEILLRDPASAWADVVPPVEEVVAAAFAVPSRGVVLARSDSLSLPARFAGGDTTLVTNLAVLDGAEELLSVVDGDPEGGASPGAVAGALHAEAAELLGVEVGDRLQLTGNTTGAITVEVTSLVEPADRTDPLWMGDPLVVDGVARSGSFTEVGPFLVAPGTFAGLGGNASYRWRRSMLADEVTPGAAAVTASRVAGLPRAIADRVQRQDADVTTGLPSLVAGSSGSIGAMSTVVGLILAQVAGVALYGLALAAFALVDTRSTETALLRSRGATAAQLGVIATVEAVLVVLPAVVAGPWLSRLVVEVLGRWGPAAGTGLELQPEVPTGAWLAALVVGALAMVIVVTPAVRAASSASRRGPRLTDEASDRVGFVRRTGLDAALAAVALFGLWQMVRAGSVTASGRADPLLIGAPALGILAVSLLVLRVFAAGATMVERSAATRRGAVPALAGWELSRRPGRLGRISVLVLLATAVGAFTAVHLSSLHRSQVEQGDARVSADLVVTPDARSRSQVDQPVLAAGYRTTPGVGGAMALDRQTVSFGAVPTAIAGVPLVSVDTGQVADLLRTPERLLGSGRADWEELHRPDDLDGVPLPGTEADVWRMEITAHPVSGADLGPDAAVDVAFHVIDRDATIHRLDGGSIPLDGTPTEVEVDLRRTVDGAAVPLAAPLEVVGIELHGPPIGVGPTDDPADLVGDAAPPDIEITIADLRVDGVAMPVGSRAWTLHDTSFSNTSVVDPTASATSDGDSITLSFNAGADGFGPARPGVVRLGTNPGLGDEPAPIPMMMTTTLAAELGLAPGDVTVMTLGGRTYDVEVAATVAAVPFAVDSERAVLADWSTVNIRRYLSDGTMAVPTDWALGVEAEAIEATTATLLNDPFRSVAVTDRVGVSGDIGRDPTTLGVSGSMVFAFVAALAVAVVGMVLTAVTGARHRRPSAAILRALGVHTGELRRLLLLETLPVVVISAAAGIATGIGLARLSLRAVAVSPDGTPAIPEPLLVVPWPAVAAVAAVVIVTGLVLPLVAARLLGRRRPADEIRFGEAG